MFSPKNSYSKEDLVACSNGDLFTKDGDGLSPLPSKKKLIEIFTKLGRNNV